MVKWSVLLPVVQERGAKQRHSGKQPANELLPPGPHLWPVSRVAAQPALMLCAITHSCASWHWVALTMMTMTRWRNPTLMIMVRMMMTLHLARISTTLSNSHCQQLGCSYHSTLVFTPGQASLASPQ